MKYLTVLLLNLSLSHSFACDFTAPTINLDKAKKSVELESVSRSILTLVTKELITIKEKPNWLILHKPKIISNKENYYSLEVIKDKFPKNFQVAIQKENKLITLKVKLMAKDPKPNRELTEFEKSCGRIPYSSIKYN